MDFKLVFTSIFLFILSWGTLQGFSQETQAATTAATVVQGGVSTDVIACMQKLMPCQPFMHSSSPPATCCSPLKEMVTEESQCLCKAFNDPKLLKTVNLTVDESLALSKACGIDVDVSMCKIGNIFFFVNHLISFFIMSSAHII